MQFTSDNKCERKVAGSGMSSNDSRERIAIGDGQSKVAKLCRLLNKLMRVGRTLKKREVAFALQFYILNHAVEDSK